MVDWFDGDGLEIEVKVAVIGAGWAGLSAALDLAGKAQVSLFEAGGEVGGRAASYGHETCFGKIKLDHGQHLLMGAYHETRALLKLLNLNEKDFFVKRPFFLSLFHKNGRFLDMALPEAGGKFWQFLRASWTMRGLHWGERLAILRVFWALQRCRFCPPEMTVAAYLLALRQPTFVMEALWEPLVLAALNTPIERASMPVFAAVLRDSLFGQGDDLCYFFPKTALNDLFAFPAVNFLKKHGVSLNFNHRVKNLSFNDDVVLVDGEAFDYAIVAVAPQQLAFLLPDLSPVPQRFEPILTLYLQYQDKPRLPAIMCAMAGTTAQWVLDREAILGERGMLAVVVSCAKDLILKDKKEIKTIIADEIFSQFGGGEPIWSWLIVDKRATFSAETGLKRLDFQVGRRLFLAGDYLHNIYPATLESAVQSGRNAAKHVLEQ